jgi:hypothetical protein
MQQFNDAYWASKHPDVRALRGMERMSEERTAAAVELMKRGFIIDKVIDLGEWDAYDAMRAREVYGFTWVPSLGQEPIAVMPGVEFPGHTYDAKNPPPGSIRVSSKAEDYRPFDAPAPAKPPSAITLPPVGLPFGGGYYDSNDREAAAGTVLSYQGSTYEKGTTRGLFGDLHWWRKLA